MAAGGSGNQQGKRGGGMMGGRQSDSPPHAGRGGGAVAGLGNPGGGFNRNSPANNGAFAGMGGLNARRTQNVSPSYQGTLGNFGKAISRSIPGAGMVVGAGLDIAGLRPGFSGFTGNVRGPGDYDPKNASGMQRDGGDMRRFMPNPLLRGLQARPQAAAAPQGLLARGPQTRGPMTLSVGGGLPYSVMLPGRSFF
jgi:hypothetical protein